MSATVATSANDTVARIRDQPRKKPPELKIDLNGDGRPERLRATQKPASAQWPGGDAKGGPWCHVDIHTSEADGSWRPVKDWQDRGYCLGFFRLPMRLPRNRHVVFFGRGVVDQQEVHTDVIRWETGLPERVSWGNVPHQMIDLGANGIDAVSVLSQELYQDFIERGTMALMVLGREGFENILPFATFEVCAYEASVGGLLHVIAADRKGEALHLLAWDQEEQRLSRQHHVSVTPPGEGPPYQVARGFALACPSAGAGDLGIQYKGQRYQVTAEQRLQVLPGGGAPAALESSP